MVVRSHVRAQIFERHWSTELCIRSNLCLATRGDLELSVHEHAGDFFRKEEGIEEAKDHASLGVVRLVWCLASALMPISTFRLHPENAVS